MIELDSKLDTVKHLHFVDDNSLVFAAQDASEFFIADIWGNHFIEITRPSGISVLAVNSKQNLIATGHHSGQVLISRGESQQTREMIADAPRSSAIVTSLEFSRCGTSILMSTFETSNNQVLDVESKQLHYEFTDNHRFAKSTMTPDFRYIVSGYCDGTITVRDCAERCYSAHHFDQLGGEEKRKPYSSKAEEERISELFEISFRQVTCSPQGDTFAACIKNILLIGSVANVLKETILDHPDSVSALAWSTTSTHVLTACHDGIVRSWDAETTELSQSWDWGIGPLTAIAINPSGSMAATSSDGENIMIWDLD